MELAYETHPHEVNTKLKAQSPEHQALLLDEAKAAAELCDKMFTWTPSEYSPGDTNAFNTLAHGENIYDHFAVFGGRGSSKSHGAAEAIVELASTKKERVAAAREFQRRIAESSKQLLEDKIRESVWADQWEILDTELRNKRNGSVIIFIGLNGNNAESVGKSLEGVTLLWVDEAQLMSQRSIDILLPTIRNAGSRCVWTWNPGEEESPVDMLFRGKNQPERTLLRCQLVENNPYLYCTRLAAEMRSCVKRDSRDKYRHIWRGAHLEITDATIFKDIHKSYLNFAALTGPPLPLHGMDFGLGGDDPSAAVKLYLVPPSIQPNYSPNGNLKPIIYISAEAVERAVPNHELYRLAHAVGAVDRTILCDNAVPLMISALQGAGVSNAAPAVKVLSRLRSGLSAHLGSLSFEGQGAFAAQR